MLFSSYAECFCQIRQEVDPISHLKMKTHPSQNLKTQQQQVKPENHLNMIVIFKDIKNKWREDHL